MFRYSFFNLLGINNACGLWRFMKWDLIGKLLNISYIFKMNLHHQAHRILTTWNEFVQYVFNYTTVITNASVNPWSGEKRWGGLKIKQKINTRLMDGFSCSFGLLSTHKATWKSRKVQKGKINITLKCEWINWHHFQPISTVMKFFWHTVKVWCLNALYHFNNLLLFIFSSHFTRI